MNTFEYNFSRFCAPAIVGIKTSNLFCCINEHYENLDREIEKIQNKLSFLNLKFYILSQTAERTMILVFQEDKLKNQLSNKEIQKFLSRFGYNTNGSYLDMLSLLKERINTGNNFPHEIGVFLGYPLEDVVDFIENKKTCKLIGTWKVYNNVSKAKEKFEEYKFVTNYICNKLKNNIELEQIVKEYKGEKC